MFVVADFRVTEKILRPCTPKEGNFKRSYFGIGVLQKFGTTWQVPNFVHQNSYSTLMFVYSRFTNNAVSETDINTRTVAQHELYFISMDAICKYS